MLNSPQIAIVSDQEPILLNGHSQEVNNIGIIFVIYDKKKS